MTPTKWVLTVATTEDNDRHITVHVIGTREQVELGRQALNRYLDEPLPEDAVREVPATWDCDGRDGCTQNA